MFITFEGPDGSGKSTQARLLAEALRARGHDVVETHEPGGTPLGVRLRELILDKTSPDPTPVAMVMLLSASRAQLVKQVIRPALAAGKIVIADRYADSTVAYQSFGLGVPRKDVAAVTAVATGGLVPDLTIYVDIQPESGLQRVRSRGATNRLDEKELAFHRRVRNGYFVLMREEPDRWVKIDGGGSPGAVQAAIMEEIEPRLGEVAGAF
jgi:dTMP kinase